MFMTKIYVIQIEHTVNIYVTKIVYMINFFPKKYKNKLLTKQKVT